MSSQTTNDDPPAYQRFEESPPTITDCKYLDCAKSHTERPCDNPSDARDEPKLHFPPLHDRVSRLRRFLAFCLAIDYSIPHKIPERLTADEMRHFLSLARHCFRRQGSSPPLINAFTALDYLEPSDELRRWNSKVSSWVKVSGPDPTIISEIVEPAKALGILTSVVISMLRIFIASIAFFARRGSYGRIHFTANQGYRSQHLWIASDSSLKNLAAKFNMDRRILPILFDSQPEFRVVLEELLEKDERKWFERLHRTLNCFVIAEDKNAWVAASVAMRNEMVHPERYKGGWNFDGPRMLNVQRDCWRAGIVERTLSEKSDWITKVWRWHFKTSRLCIQS